MVASAEVRASFDEEVGIVVRGVLVPERERRCARETRCVRSTELGHGFGRSVEQVGQRAVAGMTGGEGRSSSLVVMRLGPDSGFEGDATLAVN